MPTTSAAVDAAAGARLRDAGLRVTRPRAAVLAELDRAASAHEHLSAAQVVARVRAGSPVSPQGVYDCLDALADAGLARRIELAGQPARFESRVGDNHHHLVCRSCGRTEDVDCAVGPAPCLTPSPTPALAAGFVVDEAEVTFWGLCADCAAPARRAS